MAETSIRTFDEMQEQASHTASTEERGDFMKSILPVEVDAVIEQYQDRLEASYAAGMEANARGDEIHSIEEL